MGNREVKGRVRVLTDADLRADLAANMKNSEIARKYGVTPAAVTQRVKRLKLTTAAAAVVAPQESKRFVRQSLTAQDQLLKGLDRVNRLMDACDVWLQDADDPEKYDVGARAEDIMVTFYDVEMGPDGKAKAVKKKKSLGELLNTISGTFWIERTETKHSDPRELILKTVQEARSTVTAMADLARMLADAKAMETFRNAMLSEIAKVAPEVASNIAEAVRRSIILSGALEGVTALPAPAD